MPGASRKPGLSEKERAFVRAYTGPAKGVGTVAAKMAGYSHKGASVRAVELLARRSVRVEIQRLRAMAVQRAVATNEQIDLVLSGLLKHPDWKARAVAARELNKTRGRHSVKHMVEGTLTLEQAIAASRMEEPPIEGEIVKSLPALPEKAGNAGIE